MLDIKDINLNQFEIPQVSLEGFLKSIKKLQKKALKIGVALINVKVSESYIKEWTIPGQPFAKNRVPYVTVSVEGDSPIIAGWAFIARFEFSKEFGLLVKKIDRNATIPSRYLEDNGNQYLCEHCHNNRARRKVYVVQEVETGEWKQVGSSCVKDFTGHVSPEKLARYWSIIETLDDMNEEDWDLGRSSREEYGELLLGEYLTRVATMTKAEGFVSKAQVIKDGYGISTAESCVNWMYARTVKEKHSYDNLVIEESDAELAEKAIEWAKNINGKEAWDNEFKMNLRNIAVAGTVPIYHIGHAGYMIEAYKKAIGWAEKDNKDAEYYPAELKDRVDLEGLTLDFHTSFDGLYGTTHLYKFKKDNYVFIWFASSGQGLTEGDRVDMKATIKDKKEYQGTKQTIITRARINKE